MSASARTGGPEGLRRVAAGALVPEGMRVPPGSLVMGVPGRIVRQVDPDLKERIAGTWTHYVEQARDHRAGKYR